MKKKIMKKKQNRTEVDLTDFGRECAKFSDELERFVVKFKLCPITVSQLLITNGIYNALFEFSKRDLSALIDQELNEIEKFHKKMNRKKSKK